MTRLVIPVPMRWRDIDGYGHINNVAVLQVLEEARIAAFWRSEQQPGQSGVPASEPYPTALLDSGPGAPLQTVVASQSIEYLRPIRYERMPLTVQLWLGKLGTASIDVCYEVTEAAPPAPGPAAKALASLVLVDGVSGSPRRIPDQVRQAWEPYVEDPVVFRRPR